MKQFMRWLLLATSALGVICTPLAQATLCLNWVDGTSSSNDSVYYANNSVALASYTDVKLKKNVTVWDKNSTGYGRILGSVTLDPAGAGQHYQSDAHPSFIFPNIWANEYDQTAGTVTLNSDGSESGAHPSATMVRTGSAQHWIFTIGNDDFFDPQKFGDLVLSDAAAGDHPTLVITGGRNFFKNLTIGKGWNVVLLSDAPVSYVVEIWVLNKLEVREGATVAYGDISGRTNILESGTGLVMVGQEYWSASAWNPVPGNNNAVNGPQGAGEVVIGNNVQFFATLLVYSNGDATKGSLTVGDNVLLDGGFYAKGPITLGQNSVVDYREFVCNVNGTGPSTPVSTPAPIVTPTPTPTCAPSEVANEPGGVAYLQDLDVTPKNFTVGKLNDDSSVLIKTSYDNANWSGDVKAYRLDAKNTPSTIEDWKASTTVTAQAAGGHLVATTLKSATTTEINVNSIPAVDPTLTSEIEDDKPATYSGSAASFVSDMIDYVLGDTSKEGSGFRGRPSNVMGSINYCEPLVLGNSKLRYPNFVNGSETSHLSFLDSQHRDNYSVTCGSDGAIRFLQLEGNDKGKEKAAYIPQAILKSLGKLTNPNEEHDYFADGGNTIADAYVNGAWKTIDVFNCGYGGSCMAALDLTYSGTDLNPKAMWELSNNDLPGANKLGLTIGKATIARVKQGSQYRWFAIFGNGYPTANSKTASLLLVDLADKTNTIVIPVPNNQDYSGAVKDNGLGMPAVVDVDGDGTAERVFAGDGLGNIWHFDLSDIKVASTPTLIYKVCCRPRSMWTQPQVIYHSDKKRLIVATVTGQYTTTADHANPAPGDPQAFHVLFVDPLNVHRISSLQGITIAEEGTVGEFNVRTLVSQNGVPQDGWFLDLPSGERVISNGTTFKSAGFFSTLAITDNSWGAVSRDAWPVCKFHPQASGWLMEFNLETGLAFNNVVLDLSGDGHFDGQDMLKGQVPAGISLSSTLLSTPSILALGDPTKVSVVIGTKDGSISLVHKNLNTTEPVRSRLIQ